MANPLAINGDDADSDVEIEGMEVDDIESQEDAESQATEEDPLPPEEEEDADDGSGAAAAEEERRAYDEAVAERKALLEKETSEKAAAAGLPQDNGETAAAADPYSKFGFLIAQSEVFAHFLAGSIAAEEKKGKGKKKKGGGAKKGRMSEAAEDAQLMAVSQSARKVTRLDKQPSILAPECKMHAYQLEGLNWMIKLHDNGINGILADEMGLGKTLQSISLLAWLREGRGVKGPHLVVVPKSVVGNWMREIKKWCPVIRALKMLGTKEERKRVCQLIPPNPNTGKYRFDVLVTSYEGILKEKGTLINIPWNYLMIDEAHRIKNENSSLSKVVRLMNTKFRILITGTPLQNNLHELWALLNFLLPEVFGDAEMFDKWFTMSGKEGQENVIKKLHTVLRPFMLRRVKKDVACSLPPKKETKLYVGLTAMQQEWYTKLLRKDAHELNSLGGPDKVRLLNILMQLRKCCNHPYLFEGAEPGPPYSDGPHLWENCGKMLLLHKLLPKLKAQGSRVLIFTQMTRVLDILEDYLRMLGHEYCRIDGNTDGDARDNAIADFNEPGSSKFCFILSTRAGGLGINLATADIVVLYDSDWNPQVDLQAMDRAHRIGQTKPVQVFRFICEGSVEEKIVERADRKLFLDAAVVQQGRLAEQNTKVGKDELMHMVRFGADQILSKKEGTYTDEDIDALISRGETKTAEMKAKLTTNAQHNLADFSITDAERDTFSFGGENYRDKRSSGGNFINLPQRERKRNYDVDEYYRDTLSMGQVKATDFIKKRRKGPALQDFQLYNIERIEELNAIEEVLGARKQERLIEIRDLRLRSKHAPSINNARISVAPADSSEELLRQAAVLESTLAEFELSTEHTSEKDVLTSEAFPDWSKKDFKSFCSSMERHGRFDVGSIVDDVVLECGKTEEDVKRYYVAFWTNYKRIADWKKIMERIEKGEKKITKLRQIRDAITKKVERHRKGSDVLSWQTMTFNYGPYKGRAYTEEEDAFLVCMMYRHGYASWERIRMEIRKAWQFRFDWFFKSRNAVEIQKRCEVLVKIIERENEESQRKIAEKAANELRESQAARDGFAGEQEEKQGFQNKTLASTENPGGGVISVS